MDIPTMVIMKVHVRMQMQLTYAAEVGKLVQEVGAVLNAHIEPGQFVVHPQQRDWGVGQVQSAIDDRITVNFPHAGKVLINARVVSLEIVRPAPRD